MTPPLHSPRRGVSLIELTVVIAMILSLTSGLFLSANYYKESADQASCIVQIESMQKALRSYQNFNNLSAGTAISKGDLIGPDKAIPNELFCPHAGGAYVFKDIIPAASVAFAVCEEYDTAVDPTQNHTAPNTELW